MVLILSLSVAIVNFMYFIVNLGEQEAEYQEWFIIQCFAIVLIFLLGLVQTWWVLWKLKTALQAEKVRDRENSYTDSSKERKIPKAPPRTHTQQASFNLDEEKEILELDIIDIINEPIGFEAFMSHLAKEFSMENLLGVVEMTQYKQRYRQIRKIKKDIEEGNDPLEKRGSMKITKVVFKVLKSLSVTQQQSPNNDSDIATSDEEDNGDIDVTPWVDPDEDDGDENDGDNTNDKKEKQPKKVKKVRIAKSTDNKMSVVNEEMEMSPQPQPGPLSVVEDGTPESNNNNDDLPPIELEKKKILKKSLSQLRKSATMINVTEQCIELPLNLPYSTIVYGKNYDPDDREKDIENIKSFEIEKEAIRIINELFSKYIFVGSEMELNLSHRLRRRCLDKLSYVDRMDDIELEHMFDKCCASLLKLMQDSYLRFKETKAFIRYEEKAKKRIRNNSLVKDKDLGGIFGDLM